MLAHFLQHWLIIKQGLCRRHPQTSVLNCVCVLLIDASKSTRVIESGRMVDERRQAWPSVVSVLD